MAHKGKLGGDYTAQRSFRFHGRDYVAGEEFPWRRLSCSDRALRRLVDARYVCDSEEYEAIAAKRPFSDPVETVEVVETEEEPVEVTEEDEADLIEAAEAMLDKDIDNDPNVLADGEYHTDGDELLMDEPAEAFEEAYPTVQETPELELESTVELPDEFADAPVEEAKPAPKRRGRPPKKK